MKKYKVHFSIFNIFSDSQSEVVKLQTIVKSISAAAVGTVWYESNATNALFFAMGGCVIDAILACFYFEPVNAPEPKP